MKAVQIVGPGKLEFNDIEGSDLRQGEVKIVVAAAAVCGSDLKVIGAPALIPSIPGHEFSGVIVASFDDKNRNFHFGSRVTVFPMISCMKCSYCLHGAMRDCNHKLSLGFHLPGAFAEEINVDARFVVELDDGLTLEQGALVEHLCCGYRLAQELKLSKLPLDSHIVIIGDGPIAIADLQMLLLLNYRNITLVGKHASRLNLALTLGVKRAINYLDAAIIIRKSQDCIVDVCIFAAAADETLMSILPMVKRQGLVFPQTRITEPEPLKFLSCSTIKLGRAFAYELEDFQVVMQIMLDKKINTDLLVSNRVNLSQFVDYFSENYKSKSAGKIIIVNNKFNEIVKYYEQKSKSISSQ
jgi:L-iditol 2-dehydrogenase